MITITNKYNDTTLTIVPSKMTWSLMDISSAESGRTYTGYMYKNRVAQKRKLQLEFAGLTWAKASQILQWINVGYDSQGKASEYIWVTYPDMMSGRMEEREFYVGDREFPVWIWTNGDSTHTEKKIGASLAFDLIER